MTTEKQSILLIVFARIRSLVFQTEAFFLLSVRDDFLERHDFVEKFFGGWWGW